MNADDPPVTGGNAQLPATVAPPRSRQPVPVRALDEGGPASDGSPLPGSGHRLWWRWLLIGLLAAVSAGVTALFVVTLATDLLQRHWAQALDTTREAVPAAVGWGVLFMIFFVGGATGASRRSPADCDEVEATELRDAVTQLRATAEADAVHQAEECVQSLTARLRMLAAGEQAAPECSGSLWSRRSQSVRPETPPARPRTESRPDSPPPDSRRPESPPADSPPADTRPPESPPPDSPPADTRPPESPPAESPPPDRSLAREVAETSARLDRARQWLISAQAALATTREAAASQANEKIASPASQPAGPVRRPGGPR
jgi:hypothetical protein